MKKINGGKAFSGYILFLSVYLLAFLAALLFLRDYWLVSSPYQSRIDLDYVEWFVDVRTAPPLEDSVKMGYTGLNYLAMFAELVVFLEIFLKKENRRRLSPKLLVPCLAADAAIYFLFRRYAAGVPHCALYMVMVPWALVALTFLIFLLSIRKRPWDAGPNSSGPGKTDGTETGRARRDG